MWPESGLLSAQQRAQGGLSSLSGSSKASFSPRKDKPGGKGDPTASRAEASPARAQSHRT